jgi:beta-lactamase class A
MVACQTGAHRLRVGAPPGWIVGDKTGSSANGATHDVAVFWPPHGSALIVCVFYVGSSRPAAERDAVLAEVGRLSLAALERRSSRSGPLG